MVGSVVGVLVAACLTAVVIKETEAVCCGSVAGGFCKDCTKATPYCGYQSCNIFGCACGGGCRRDCGYTFTESTSLGPWATTGSEPSKCVCTNKRSVADEASDANDPMSVFSGTDRDRDAMVEKRSMDADSIAMAGN